MTRIYDICCKDCWKTWKSKNIYSICPNPKCRSTNLDIIEDLDFEG